MTGNRIVYDSELGRLNTCATCGKRFDRCRCGRQSTAPAKGPAANLPKDGVVRILRDRKSRGGKVVTVIAGVPGGAEALTRLATELKRVCGSGGTAKPDQAAIEIQGDHRDRVADLLRQRGYTVKLAGG